MAGLSVPMPRQRSRRRLVGLGLAVSGVVDLVLQGSGRGVAGDSKGSAFSCAVGPLADVRGARSLTSLRGASSQAVQLRRAPVQLLRDAKAASHCQGIERQRRRIAIVDKEPMALALSRRMLGDVYSLFLELVVHSSVWMSLCLASLVPFLQLEGLGVAGLDWRPFWAGASESLAVYTLDHLRDMRKPGAKALLRTSRGALRARLLQVFLVAALLGFVGMLVSAPSSKIAGVFVGHLVLCVVYAKLKKRIPCLKAAYVSLCVVFMTVAAPTAYAPGLLEALGGSGLLRLVLLVGCVSFTIENLQDSRDVEEDDANGVVTLPSAWGITRTKHFLLAVQVGCALLHCTVGWAAGLSLRPELLAIYGACAACSMVFTDSTPRSLFQVALEPLYALPLMAVAVRAAMPV
eukprot:TRINITY_DN21626_c0_g1_i1.p1 TRINITY_DN21626_c0_g1~~TRINITY_DN21626_c0_g1_i1.p1  ORF type:complete len:405 (-),score=40.03 TRINITY_DN21626_c0_g1_i1:179-1393(-)